MTDTVPPARTHGQGVVERGVVGHGVDDRVGPPAAGRLEHRLHRRPLHRLGPRVRGPVPAGRPPGRRPAPGRPPGPGPSAPRTARPRPARAPPPCRPGRTRPAGPRPTRCDRLSVEQERGLVVHPLGDRPAAGSRRPARPPRWPGRRGASPSRRPSGPSTQRTGSPVAHPSHAAAAGHRRGQHPVPDPEPPHLGPDLERPCRGTRGRPGSPCRGRCPRRRSAGRNRRWRWRRPTPRHRRARARSARAPRPPGPGPAPRSSRVARFPPVGRWRTRSTGPVVEYCGTPIRGGSGPAPVARSTTRGPDMRNPHAGEPFDTSGRGDRRGAARREHPHPAAVAGPHVRRPRDHPGPAPAGRAVPQRGPGLHVRGGQGRGPGARPRGHPRLPRPGLPRARARLAPSSSTR